MYVLMTWQREDIGMKTDHKTVALLFNTAWQLITLDLPWEGDLAWFSAYLSQYIQQGFSDSSVSAILHCVSLEHNIVVLTNNILKAVYLIITIKNSGS